MRGGRHRPRHAHAGEGPTALAAHRRDPDADPVPGAHDGPGRAGRAHRPTRHDGAHGVGGRPRWTRAGAAPRLPARAPGRRGRRPGPPDRLAQPALHERRGQHRHGRRRPPRSRPRRRSRSSNTRPGTSGSCARVDWRTTSRTASSGAGRAPSGIAIWSKSPVVVGDSADTTDRILEATVTSAAGPVRVLAVHAHTPISDFEIWKGDLDQFGDLGITGDDPTLVIGDFNASFWHPNFRGPAAQGVHRRPHRPASRLVGELADRRLVPAVRPARPRAHDRFTGAHRHRGLRHPRQRSPRADRHRFASSLSSARNARPRCDSSCFASGPISANVRPSPSSGTKIGVVAEPDRAPVLRRDRARADALDRELRAVGPHDHRHGPERRRARSVTPASSASSLRPVVGVASTLRPRSARCTRPAAPPRASTSSPVSSATAGRPGRLA